MVAGFKTGGRSAGTPNKVTASVREAVLGALEEAGGAKYLLGVARENPQVFCALLGKLLPSEITGKDGGSVELQVQAQINAGAAVMDAKLNAMRSRLQEPQASATD